MVADNLAQPSLIELSAAVRPPIPSTVSAETPKEDALGLLKLAAEIEHALMVQYLYAAWSLPFDDAHPNESTARQTILEIAVQEMLHLLSVQNLLLALGGVSQLHLGRDAIRAGSNFNPLPLLLERLDHSSLAKYIVAEMPAEIPDPALRNRVEALRNEAQTAAGVDVNQVGAIYSALHWIFQDSDADMPTLGLGLMDGYRAGWHLQPSDFQAPEVIDEFSAIRDAWHAGQADRLLEVVKTPADGLKLLRSISEQGEGFGPGIDSHFERFLEILDAMEGAALKPLALPNSPYASHSPPGDVSAGTQIVNPYTRAWCDWFDVRYNMLWLDIGHALSTPASDALRDELISLAFSGMVTGLSQMAELVLKLPLDAVGGACAGPPFGLLYPSLPDLSGFKQRHLELLQMEHDIANKLQAFPELINDEEASSLFDRYMRSGGIHERRRSLINQLP